MNPNAFQVNEKIMKFEGFRQFLFALFSLRYKGCPVQKLWIKRAAWEMFRTYRSSKIIPVSVAAKSLPEGVLARCTRCATAR